MREVARFNRLVRAAAQNEPLRGVTRPRTGTASHHWLITAEPDDDPRMWKVFVGAGTVNERDAAIVYRRSGDPRGWVPAQNDPAVLAMEAIYGAGVSFVDRSLLDGPETPYLLLTAPDAGNEAAAHGFRAVEPDDRPEALRGAVDWERDLYLAHVFLTALPAKADPALAFLPPGTTRPDQPDRFRVYAGQMPAGTLGTEAGGTMELGRLWLLRDPSNPESDEIRIEQRQFWSFRAAALTPFFQTGLEGFDFGFGGLGFGITELLLRLTLDEINEALSGLGGVRWWTV